MHFGKVATNAARNCCTIFRLKLILRERKGKNGNFEGNNKKTTTTTKINL